MASTKDQIVAAAIQLLGEEGMRSFTHRRVDRRAGLPEGSASNHFRTRDALLAGAVDGIVEAELGGVGPELPGDADGLIEALAVMIERTTGSLRTHTLARQTLFLEASRIPELRDKLSASRRQYVGLVTAALARIGVADVEASTSAVLAVCEGLILHRLGRDDRTDPRPALEVVILGDTAR